MIDYGWQPLEDATTQNDKHVAVFINDGQITDSKLFDTLEELNTFINDWKNKMFQLSEY